MQKIVFGIILLSTTVKSCSITADAILSTVQDQVKHAGAVIKGTAKEILGDINASSVIFKNVVFYKGSGPSEILVEGFSNDALCGVSPPDQGKRAFAFLCRKNGQWVLNSINVFTGAIQFNKKNEKIVEEETKDNLRYEGWSGISYFGCTKPDPESLRRPPLLAPEPVLIAPEPTPLDRDTIPSNSGTSRRFRSSRSWRSVRSG